LKSILFTLGFLADFSHLRPFNSWCKPKGSTNSNHQDEVLVRSEDEQPIQQEAEDQGEEEGKISLRNFKRKSFINRNLSNKKKRTGTKGRRKRKAIPTKERVKKKK